MNSVRAAVAIALAGGAVLSAGCTVGGGAGKALGTLWVEGCSNSEFNGSSQANPAPYNLQPSYFAGIPLDDLSPGPSHTNQISMRMQSNGLASIYADILEFDVLNSYEVARCVRGQVSNGQPQWNVTEPLPSGAQMDWCDWSATAFADGGAGDGGTIDGGAPGADGGTVFDGGVVMNAMYPKIHLSPYTDIHATLNLAATCPTDTVSATAVDGWISFQEFGSAGQPDLAPSARGSINSDFIINNGDRLHATFHVVLEDDAIVNAMMSNLPPPTPQIGGTIDGYFDFDLERGRSLQPFP